MAIPAKSPVFVENFGFNEGNQLRIKQAALIVLGIVALAVAAKIQVVMWPSPVPITLGTFAVLAIGVAYGPVLGLLTILGYLTIGAAGFDVFASSSAETYGIAYMMGGSGGYLLGYVLAVAYLGWSARRGLDRSFDSLCGAMLVANALIYVPGVLWLRAWIIAGDRFNAETFGSVWDQTLAWGLTPYLIGDLLKLAVAAMVLPILWKLVGRARQ